MFLAHLLDSHLTSPQSASGATPLATGALIIVVVLLSVATLRAKEITISSAPSKSR